MNFLWSVEGEAPKVLSERRQAVVVCIACRAHLDESPHKFGCTMTRRIVSDEKLAEVLLRRGLV